jgi:hypothetical protein
LRFEWKKTTLKSVKKEREKVEDDNFNEHFFHPLVWNWEINELGGCFWLSKQDLERFRIIVIMSNSAWSNEHDSVLVGETHWTTEHTVHVNWKNLKKKKSTEQTENRRIPQLKIIITWMNLQVGSVGFRGSQHKWYHTRAHAFHKKPNGKNGYKTNHN